MTKSATETPLSAFAVTAAICLSIALIEAWRPVVLLARPDGRLHHFLPNRKQTPPAVFFALLILSCVATTVGFALSAWTIALAATH
jgi:hypothetical protein